MCRERTQLGCGDAFKSKNGAAYKEMERISGAVRNKLRRESVLSSECNVYIFMLTANVSALRNKRRLPLKCCVLRDIAETPQPPSNLTVVNVTSRAVTLRWSRGFDGNSQIKWYRLVYRGVEMGNGMRAETKEAIVDGDTNTTHLQNLHPVTTYRLTLSAQNEIGASDDSEAISVTTLEEGTDDNFARN